MAPITVEDIIANEVLDGDVEADLVERAIRAYCTRERRAGRVVQQPSLPGSYTFSPCSDYLHGDGAFTTDRNTYAVLTNINGVLGVYRLRDDGHIEYVAPKYWPDALVEAERESVC